MTTLLSVSSAKEITTCCGENDVKIFADGVCLWYREFQLSISHCPIDITWFPFDDQHCDLIYESKTHESSELNITKMSTAVALNYYSNNSEWQLLGKTPTITLRGRK